jgi:hypothetical protein
MTNPIDNISSDHDLAYLFLLQSIILRLSTFKAIRAYIMDATSYVYFLINQLYNTHVL